MLDSTKCLPYNWQKHRHIVNVTISKGSLGNEWVTISVLHPSHCIKLQQEV